MPPPLVAKLREEFGGVRRVPVSALPYFDGRTSRGLYKIRSLSPLSQYRNIFYIEASNPRSSVVTLGKWRARIHFGSLVRHPQ